MSLQNPWALLWAIPVLGSIIVLYLLRMRRRDVRIPASFLWQAQPEEIRANSLFQRLRPNPLMFVQLLAATILVLLFARPQCAQQGLIGETTVIVLDVSASMNTRESNSTRFEEGLRVASEAIAAAKAGDRIAIIEAGTIPRVVSPLTNDPSRAKLALESVKPSDGESDVGEALRLASALATSLGKGSSDAGARILLLSDGCFPDVENFSAGNSKVVFRAIGNRTDNLAITAFQAGKTTRGNEAYLSVRNYGSSSIPAVVNIYADGELIDSQKVAVAAGKTMGFTPRLPATAKLLTAELKADDALAADNFGATSGDPNAALNVLLVSNGNPFLERALLLDPRVILDRTASLPAEAKSPESKYDVVIFDEIPAENVSARGVLVFGTQGTLRSGRILGTESRPNYRSAVDHPVVRGVDFAGVAIETLGKVTPGAGARSLIESDQGPLVLIKDGTQREVCLPFALLKSDFPLQVGFPILIANALDFLAGDAGKDSLFVKPNIPFGFPTDEAVTFSGETKGFGFALPKEWTGPVPGPKVVTPVNSSVTLREHRRIGGYSLTIGGSRKQVLVTLNSEVESNIRPRSNVSLGTGQVSATASPLRLSDAHRPILIGLLLLLAVEWWMFARRS